MSDGLEFRLLGPLEAREGERVIHLGGVRQRSVLAMLLLHAGEVVSTDTLVDELWGEAPPEDAATALHQHVSRLRRLLRPHEVVLTRAPGYVVELGDTRLDLQRFEALRSQGRTLLLDGRANEAAEVLREALALWRGRPLADLEHEPFATAAVARLDEERVEALELRVDADLARGRHDELVPELRTLVAEHPLRERLRAQLMLGLYRSGRQAEALEAYADARQTLVQELGLEPGPELRRLQQGVLEQDPDLELDRPRPPVLPAGRRRRVAVLVALGAALAVAVGVGALLAADDEPSPPRAGAGELVGIDAASGRVVQRVPGGRTPSAVAAGPGTQLWVIDADARTLLAVDPGSGESESLATGATPVDVVVGAGGVWVANGRPLESSQLAGPVATEAVRLDPTTRTQRATVPLPRVGETVINSPDNRLAATDAALWAVGPSGSVLRIDPRTAAITADRRDARAAAVAAGGAGVWALRPEGVALALDERTAEVRRRVRLPTDAASGIAVGRDAVWVTAPADGRLWRIRPGGEPEAVDVGSGVTGVAAGAGFVWLANPSGGTVTAVDASSLRVVRRVAVGGAPRSLALAGDMVWVAVAGREAATGSRVSGVEPLPASFCEPVVAPPGGRADVLVVSDLPLQGGIHVTTTQMAQAITFALRERGFRAGRFRVAYQSCDDSVGRTGLFDEAKCAANARAYGRRRDVVAVIGTLNSPCALAAVPVLNGAPGGPLAMVSPLNSFAGLTRRGVGVPPDLPDSLYEDGRRNYLRVFPTDDLQGAALAVFARDRGRERVFALDDGEPVYGAAMAAGFATASARLGLIVAGRATWDPSARSYRRLARRVAASGAEAVFVGGLLDSNAARVVRALRAELGRAVDIMGPEGLTPVPLLEKAAGPAARGLFVSLPGIVTERLPPAGAAFVRRFARAQPGVDVEPSAVYAAQAVHVVLDALARSDGTRSSVLDELFRTRVRDGLLGDFSFDAGGDITESPVTILRIDESGPSGGLRGVESGVIERVARPRAELVAPG